MLVNSLNQTKSSFSHVFTHDNVEVTAIYGGLNYSNPIYYAFDTINGAPPLSFKSNGEAIEDYTISGNTVQSGTPTPSVPVAVQGVGERTANLYDMNANDTNNGFVNGAYLYNTGVTRESSPYFVSEYIPIQPNTEYTLVYGSTAPTIPSVCFYDSSKSFISGENYNGQNPFTFTTPNGTVFIRFSGVDALKSIIMLNVGSATLPYEPYGYKLPITCGGETTAIYLSNVQTTRRVKKLVLTGTEAFSYNSGTLTYTLDVSCLGGTGILTALSSHYLGVNNVSAFSSMTDKAVCERANGEQIWIRDTDITSVADFKAFLAAQYAAGTPVTIWYVLASPETSIVNEPLQKISTYADTISSTQAGIEIPTINGTNTLTTSTTVLPSNIEATGRIKRII